MTTIPLIIRLAGPDDAAAVAAFGERSFRETFGADNRPEDMDAYCAATYAVERQRREMAEPEQVTLLAETLARAGALGRRTVYLAVWERNARAIAFYRKVGFREVGAQPFQLGKDVQTDQVMVRRLD